MPPTGAQPTTYAGLERVVFAVAFSPDGRRLASTAYDQTIRVWDIAGGAPVVLKTGQAPKTGVDYAGTLQVAAVRPNPPGPSMETFALQWTVGTAKIAGIGFLERQPGGPAALVAAAGAESLSGRIRTAPQSGVHIDYFATDRKAGTIDLIKS